MTYNNIAGNFKTRGNNGENTTNLISLGELAQDTKIINIIKNGYDTNNNIATVLVEDNNGQQKMQMVKFDLYDFMDFTSEEDLKAYNNFSDYVVRYLGAYSNKFNLH